MENYTAIREQLPAERGPTLPNALLSTCRSQLRRSQIEVRAHPIPAKTLECINPVKQSRASHWCPEMEGEEPLIDTAELLDAIHCLAPALLPRPYI